MITDREGEEMISNSNISRSDNKIILDALPYVDVVHEDYEQYALALVEAEMKDGMSPPQQETIRPIHYRSTIMEHECQRHGEGDRKPSESFGDDNVVVHPSVGGTNDVALSLDDALRQQKINYEIERIRSMNLEVLKDPYMSQLWRDHNAMLNKDLLHMKAILKKQTEMIEQVNLQRSVEQQKAGEKLSRLNVQYQELLNTRYQLQYAIQNLKNEIQEIKSTDNNQ